MRVVGEFDDWLSLSEAARTYPGGPVSVNSIRRWATDGVRIGGQNVKLASVMRGTRRVLTRQSLREFFARVQRAGNAESPRLKGSPQGAA